jgi:hypothetical protein
MGTLCIYVNARAARCVMFSRYSWSQNARNPAVAGKLKNRK